MDKDVLRQGVFLALQRPASVANPYPFYHRLRAESPFYWDFLISGWFLTRYADVAAALTDSRLTTENFQFDVTQLSPDLQEDLAPLGRIRKREALYNDGAEHERLRRPLNRAFHPAAFERLRNGLEARSRELLAAAASHESVDLVRDYAEPLVQWTLCELLAIPVIDRAQFTAWCEHLKDFVEAPRMGERTVAKARLAARSFAEMQGYVRNLVAFRTELATDDVIGRALAVEAGEAPLGADEILANCVFFLDAAMGNTSAALANGIVALLENPEEFARLRAAPQLLSSAVEELLRYDTPLHVAIRGVREEMDFAGHKVGPRQLLILLLGAANRDPDQFSDPDRLDITRRPNRHVSFGIGPHGCVGGWLARFVISLALEPLLEQKITLECPAAELRWNLPAMRRKVHALPVIVEKLPGRRRAALHATVSAH